jgi:hypothetical protein
VLMMGTLYGATDISSVTDEADGNLADTACLCPIFFGGLDFELGTLRLSHISSPFCSGYSWRWGGLMNYLPGPASNHDPPDLNLPNG